MREYQPWELDNAAFYFKYILRKEHSEVTFEEKYVLNLTYTTWPILSFKLTSRKLIDLTNFNIALPHDPAANVYMETVIHTTSAPNNYHLTMNIKGPESLKVLVNKSYEFIRNILNEHCTAKGMQAWNIYNHEQAAKHEETFLRIAQVPKPTQPESEQDKEARIKIIRTGARQLWEKVVGEPISIATKDGCKCHHGTLTQKNIEGFGLCLTLHKPSLSTLYNTFVKPSTPTNEAPKEKPITLHLSLPSSPEDNLAQPPPFRNEKHVSIIPKPKVILIPRNPQKKPAPPPTTLFAKPPATRPVAKAVTNPVIKPVAKPIAKPIAKPQQTVKPQLSSPIPKRPYKEQKLLDDVDEYLHKAKNPRVEERKQDIEQSPSRITYRK
jgi:hypothetical protein